MLQGTVLFSVMIRGPFRALFIPRKRCVIVHHDIDDGEFELGRGTNVGHYSATVVELRFTVLSTSLQIETVCLLLYHPGGPLASCSGKSSR